VSRVSDVYHVPAAAAAASVVLLVLGGGKLPRELAAPSVLCSGFRVSGLRCRASQCFGFRVQGSGFRV